jgi:DNA-binding transcriptional MerR regulator
MDQQLLLFNLDDPNDALNNDNKTEDLIEKKSHSIKSETARNSIQKKYYSIGEVAEMFKINPSSLRYWETEFSIIKPKKNRKGNRLYTQQDIEHIRTIYHLVKEKGYTIAGAKEIIKNNLQKAKDLASTIKSLEKIKNFLIELKNNL